MGYGVPAIAVTALLTVSQLDGEYHYIRFSQEPDQRVPSVCWIDPESMMWAFIGPVLFILISNFYITIMVLKVAFQATLRPG